MGKSITDLDTDSITTDTKPPTVRVPRPPIPGSELPIIGVQEGDLKVVAEQAWRALQQFNSRANLPPTLFQFGDGLARVDPSSDGHACVSVLDDDRLRHLLVRVALWRKRDKDQNLTVPARPPKDLPRDMLARPDPPLPVLKGLKTGPYITRTGRVQTTRGYDPEGQVFYDPTGDLNIRPISNCPTRDEIVRACETLLGLIADFPFASQSERANAVGLMLLPFVEQLIDGPIPAHCIDKPVPGAGAGLLTDVLLWAALGCAPSKMTEACSEEEWRKRITAKLLQGSLIVCIDNVRARLDSAALASALTETIVEDRVLGHSRVTRVPARRIWVLTGNNIQVSEEMRRRIVRIRLDPAVERPEERTGFRHPNLRRWVNEHRTELVHADLTICQAWLAAGWPKPARLPVMGSFESWAEVIGGVLEIAEIRGFLQNVDDVRTTVDGSGQAWKLLFELLFELLSQKYSHSEFGMTDVWEILAGERDIWAALELGDGNESSQKSRLGGQLRQRRDRIFDGRRLELVRSFRGANRWRLVSV
jgi:putative DNA primase/helicase